MFLGAKHKAKFKQALTLMKNDYYCYYNNIFLFALYYYKYTYLLHYTYTNMYYIQINTVKKQHLQLFLNCIYLNIMRICVCIKTAPLIFE